MTKATDMDGRLTVPQSATSPTIGGSTPVSGSADRILPFSFVAAPVGVVPGSSKYLERHYVDYALTKNCKLKLILGEVMVLGVMGDTRSSFYRRSSFFT